MAQQIQTLVADKKAIQDRLEQEYESSKGLKTREQSLGKHIDDLISEKKKVQHLLKTAEDRVSQLTKENSDMEFKYHTNN